MQINGTDQNLNQFLGPNSDLLIIPDYQRSYSWGASQWDDFWNDLITLESDNIHFLGSIVLIAKTHRPGTFNELEVVDGQQRLTTLSILIKVIHDKFVELENKRAVEESKKYLYGSILNGEERIKLNLGRIDRENYIKLLDNSFEDISDTNIFKAYKYFKVKIEEIEALEEILNKLIYNLSFVIITTDSEKSAYRLFETLNDRGLDLSAVDLIKNHLLRISTERDIDLNKIKNLWEEIIVNLNDIDKVRYFRQYLQSSSIYKIKGKITQEQLYDRFCKILDGAKDDMVEFITDINRQSLLYSQIENCSIDRFDASRDETINRYLRNIGAIKATTSYTFLLKVFNKINSAEDIIEILKLIEIFAIRRSVVGVSTADLDPIYNYLCNEVFEDGVDTYTLVKNYLEKNMPNDLEFEEKFKTMQLQQNNQTKYILDSLEIKGYGIGGEGKLIGNRYHVHIEHIAPQTMDDPSKWNGFSNLNPEEIKEYVTSIGNLTLLEKKPNIKASNSTFQEKKEFYKAEESEIKMTNDLLNYDQWGVVEIKKRGEELAKKAITIWKF